jgi:hypothetical protein
VITPNIALRLGPAWQSRQAIIFRLAALFYRRLSKRVKMRRYWFNANYLVAIALAMIGWLWLIA